MIVELIIDDQMATCGTRLRQGSCQVKRVCLYNQMLLDKFNTITPRNRIDLSIQSEVRRIRGGRYSCLDCPILLEHDVYLFEQANNGDEVNEIYHDISYGMVVEWLSAQDLNNDDKEELIIGRNSGDPTNAIIWHIVYEKDGIIQSAVPASKDLTDFGLDREVYSLPGSSRQQLPRLRGC